MQAKGFAPEFNFQLVAEAKRISLLGRRSVRAFAAEKAGSKTGKSSPAQNAPQRRIRAKPDRESRNRRAKCPPPSATRPAAAPRRTISSSRENSNRGWRKNQEARPAEINRRQQPPAQQQTNRHRRAGNEQDFRRPRAPERLEFRAVERRDAIRAIKQFPYSRAAAKKCGSSPCQIQSARRRWNESGRNGSDQRRTPEISLRRAVAASRRASPVCRSGFRRSAGSFWIAALMVGKQLSSKNQATDAAASSATMNCTSRSRLNVARANAATPRGVSGSQAKVGSAGALIQPQN